MTPDDFAAIIAATTTPGVTLSAAWDARYEVSSTLAPLLLDLWRAADEAWPVLASDGLPPDYKERAGLRLGAALAALEAAE